jgi:hypothetical protein
MKIKKIEAKNAWMLNENSQQNGIGARDARARLDSSISV